MITIRASELWRTMTNPLSRHDKTAMNTHPMVPAPTRKRTRRSTRMNMAATFNANLRAANDRATNSDDQQGVGEQQPGDDHQRTIDIKHAIVEAGNQARALLPFLQHQDMIGVSVMAIAILGMSISGALWYAGLLSAWISIPVSAFFASLIHELEHDLIHSLYFRHNRAAYNTMMALCWLTRPLTVNPWIRRRLHLNHHKHSGTESDIEERAITNGETWSAARLLMTFDGMASIFMRAFRNGPHARKFILKHGLMAYFPLGLAAWLCWYAFLLVHLSMLTVQLLHLPLAMPDPASGMVHVLDALTVILLAPNLLRSFSINLVSSNMHYYGDIEKNNILQQTQFLMPWWLMPFQAFCFNFGGTHAIHHFVVGQPFYLRQIIAGKVRPLMRSLGVRYNDTQAFVRANRWSIAEAPASSQAATDITASHAPASNTTHSAVRSAPEVIQATLATTEPSFKTLRCLVCFAEYNEAFGWPTEGIAAGTRWHAVPDDWVCPECGASKADFDMVKV